MSEGARVYRFMIGGSERLLCIANDGEYTIQNTLMEGYDYLLHIEDGVVTSAELIGELGESAAHPVAYKPGRRTLKNLLASAMQPVGTLYIYGGGWNWQDDGAALLSRRIGRPRTWRDFFLSTDADYEYKNASAPAESTYPFGGWCEYYYAGLDCSGYLGWVIYNTLETENGRPGYVFKSTEFAKTLSEMGFGSYSADKLENGGIALRSGDIVSLKGHTYLILGRCEDGSLVILHSSPPLRERAKRAAECSLARSTQTGTAAPAWRASLHRATRKNTSPSGLRGTRIGRCLIQRISTSSAPAARASSAGPSARAALSRIRTAISV